MEMNGNDVMKVPWIWGLAPLRWWCSKTWCECRAQALSLRRRPMKSPAFGSPNRRSFRKKEKEKREKNKRNTQSITYVYIYIILYHFNPIYILVFLFSYNRDREREQEWVRYLMTIFLKFAIWWVLLGHLELVMNPCHVWRRGLPKCPESFGTDRGGRQLQCEVHGSVDAWHGPRNTRCKSLDQDWSNVPWLALP